MIKINEDWSFPQPSIKCNYCMQHRVKLLWCICWDIIYATYLQRGIDLLLWMFYKRVSRDKHREICGYWGWSIIWLIMTNLLNLTSHCIFIVIWSQNLRVSFSFIIIFSVVELFLCFVMLVLLLALFTMWVSNLNLQETDTKSEIRGS